MSNNKVKEIVSFSTAVSIINAINVMKQTQQFHPTMLLMVVFKIETIDDCSTAIRSGNISDTNIHLKCALICMLAKVTTLAANILTVIIAFGGSIGAVVLLMMNVVDFYFNVIHPLIQMKAHWF